VQVAAYKEEFARWCDATVKSLHTNINGKTFHNLMAFYPCHIVKVARYIPRDLLLLVGVIVLLT